MADFLYVPDQVGHKRGADVDPSAAAVEIAPFSNPSVRRRAADPSAAFAASVTSPACGTAAFPSLDTNSRDADDSIISDEQFYKIFAVSVFCLLIVVVCLVALAVVK